jgi:hypothetical protein
MPNELKETLLENGIPVTRTRVRATVASSGVTYTLVGTDLVKTYYETDTDLVCWRVTETRPFFEFLRSAKSLQTQIPPEFRALVPEYQKEKLVLGSVVDPPLFDPGDFSKTEKQVDPLQKLVTTLFRNLGDTPKTLVDLDTSRQKQVVTVTRTWENETTVPAAPTSTRDVSFHRLGDGTAVEEHKDVPILFGGKTTSKEIPDVVPEAFRATIPIYEKKESLAGIVVDPQILGLGELFRRESQDDVFNLTRTTRTRTPNSYPVIFTEAKLAPDKQIETITSKLDVGVQTLVPTAAMLEGAVQDLGNGTSLLRTGATPTVFSHLKSVKEIADVVPDVFKAALPIFERDVTITGTVTDPQILDTGELYRSEEQLDVFNMRRISRNRGAIGYPVSVTEYKLAPTQQLATVTSKLDLGLQTLTPTAVMIGGEVRDLGNGTSLLRTEVVPEVFSHVKYEVSVPDLVPAEFRPTIPIISTEETVEGVAVPPVLGATDMFASDEQVTALTHRTRVGNRATPTLPIILLGEEMTEQFGGGNLLVIKTLDLAGMVTDTGLTTVSSVVKNLGNGMALKETRQLAGTDWPIVSSQMWDDETQNWRLEQEQVVAAGTVPASGLDYVESVKAIDRWRSKRIRTQRSFSAVDAGSAIQSVVYAPFKFPGWVDHAASGVYIRKASAQLCKFIVRTWWQVLAGNIPPAVHVDEIFTDSCLINQLNDVSKLDYANDVLHDDLTVAGLFFPATTPTASQYKYGSLAGYNRVGVASLYAPGSGYTVGNSLAIVGGAGTCTVVVDSVGVSNSIISYHQASQSGWSTLGTFGPFAVSGGSGTGAQFNIFVYDQPIYTAGTQWIGTERVVAASVTKTTIPNLWKIQTKSTVMK